MRLIDAMKSKVEQHQEEENGLAICDSYSEWLAFAKKHPVSVYGADTVTVIDHHSELRYSKVEKQGYK